MQLLVIFCLSLAGFASARQGLPNGCNSRVLLSGLNCPCTLTNAECKRGTNSRCLNGKCSCLKSFTPRNGVCYDSATPPAPPPPRPVQQWIPPPPQPAPAPAPARVPVPVHYHPPPPAQNPQAPIVQSQPAPPPPPASMPMQNTVITNVKASKFQMVIPSNAAACGAPNHASGAALRFDPPLQVTFVNAVGQVSCSQNPAASETEPYALSVNPTSGAVSATEGTAVQLETGDQMTYTLSCTDSAGTTSSGFVTIMYRTPC